MSSQDGLRFASYVPPTERGALEQLIFFNTCQARVLRGIVDAIELYGTPDISADRNGLTVKLSGVSEAQSLFALDSLTGRPVGVAVYMRPDVENITVLHISIAREFASGGLREKDQLLLRMLRELRRCTRRVKGVRRMELFYAADRSQRRLRGPRRPNGIKGSLALR